MGAIVLHYCPITMDESIRLTLAHSPDSDDAFMFWALSKGFVSAEGIEFEHILSDIQALNQAAMANRYDITAISFHAWPYVSQNYSIMNVGASVGDGYGPIIVSTDPIDFRDLHKYTLGIPGSLTTAALVLRLALPGVRTEEISFDQIIDAVKKKDIAAGVIIHEGQITYEKLGMHCVVDLGKWWLDETGLPLPLGGNVIRKELGEETTRKVVNVIRESIAYGFEHRKDGIDYAGKYGRDLRHDDVDRFVSMYVNDYTMDLGEKGRQAVRELLKRAGDAGIVPLIERIDFVG